MAAFSKILFPTDFSGYSNGVLDHALAWAGKFNADVHMVHVVTVHNFDPFNPELGFPEVGEDLDLHESAQQQMDKIAGDSGETDVTVTRETRTGFSPWSEIINAALEKQADLIMMATHGRKGLQHLFLGSTAEKVLEHAPCPVLLLRPDEDEVLPPPGEVESILFPTDLSGESSQAVPMALELAVEFGAKLNLLHSVEQDVPPPYYAAGITSIFDLNDTVLEVSREQMAKLIPDDLVAKVDHDFIVREGNSAQQVVAFAREAAVDLIVMATHGYSGLEQALLGSTTDRVVRNTPCPVLVVRCSE
jgi:nucleotide-binding universal stress UspA family protein